MRICPNCRARVEDDYKFCCECSAPLPEISPSEPFHAEPGFPQPETVTVYVPVFPKKKSHKGLIALLISLGVLVLAGATAAVLFLTGVFDLNETVSAPSVAESYAAARYEKPDASALVECLPEEAWSSILKTNMALKADVLAYLQSYTEHSVSDRTYVLQEIDTEMLTDAETETLNQQLSLYLEEDITSAMTCIFIFRSEIGGEEYEVCLEETFIEYDGEWYVSPKAVTALLKGYLQK